MPAINKQPFDIPAEEALLGNVILLGGEAIRKLDQCGFAVNDFYLDKHKRLYSVLRSMHENGVPIDSVSLMHTLKQYEILDRIGGVVYITHSLDSTIKNKNVLLYARYIIDEMLRRELTNIGFTIVNRSFDGDPLDDIIQEAEDQLSDLRARHKETSERMSLMEVKRNDIHES